MFTLHGKGEGVVLGVASLPFSRAAPLQNNKCVLEKNIFDDANILLVISYMK